ncbi:FecR family protein [Steroidobacter sp.]|uniref:FecR family protein n=1 Tax=Steroidobacter sp. TaxID=1978227 RepID=UPI001A646B16|nr:FecR family protein [Steroidobacter sp.]MBL8267664.1 FecR family protein [Steroidobacter sp.]
MTDQQRARLSAVVLDEATTWFVELLEGAQDERTRGEFLEWLRSSPQNVRAYLQVAAHWEDDASQLQTGAGRLESVDELLAMARSENNVVPLAAMNQSGNIATGSAPTNEDNVAEALPGVDGRRSVQANGRGKSWTRRALAAGVVLAVIASGVTYHLQRDVYSTRVGEQRSIKLDDGSTVEINSRSRIKVRYSEHVRQVDLLEGQALFDVAKNKARPFVVHSGDVRIQAVGTQFDVYRKTGGTVVTVVEGSVSIQDAAPGKQVLAAGEQIVVSPSVAPAKPKTADIAAVTAWTQRRLVFTREPLSEVVQQFNRYNTRPLVITDPDIAATEISGTFSSGDPSSLLRFLREVGAYRIRETDDAIQISSQQ